MRHNKKHLTSNTRIDRPYDFNTAIAALNSLNEDFSYKDEELLSDEEVKEITAKIAELEPQYKEARAKKNTKYNELKTTNGSLKDISNDPEYRQLDEVAMAI